MNQQTGKKIEAFWKQIGIVRFYPSEPNNEVPAVVLVFPNADNDTSKGYELLLDNYKNNETKLTIKRRGGKVDLTVTDGKEGTEFTLKGWTLMLGELERFTAREQPDEPFAFMIGSLNFEHGMVISATRKPFTPHIVGSYAVTK